FPAQGLADIPAPSIGPDLAVAIELAHLRSRRIFPARRLRIVGPWTGAPQRSRRSHVQRFMRTHFVMLSTKLIQPRLPRLALPPTTPPRPLQFAMKALHLALRLRMPHPAPVQPDALLHQPHRQFRGPRRR